MRMNYFVYKNKLTSPILHLSNSVQKGRKFCAEACVVTMSDELDEDDITSAILGEYRSSSLCHPAANR